LPRGLVVKVGTKEAGGGTFRKENNPNNPRKAGTLARLEGEVKATREAKRLSY